MVSSRTINRKRKIEILKGILGDIIDILLLSDKYRDWVNMKEYKDLADLVKSIKDKAKPL